MAVSSCTALSININPTTMYRPDLVKYISYSNISLMSTHTRLYAAIITCKIIILNLYCVPSRNRLSKLYIYQCIIKLHGYISNMHTIFNLILICLPELSSNAICNLSCIPYLIKNIVFNLLKKCRLQSLDIRNLNLSKYLNCVKLSSPKFSILKSNLLQCILTLCFKTLKLFTKAIINMVLWLTLINLFLVIIANPSLLNPGPLNSLSIMYHNVQGFIPVKAINDTNPQLNFTKLFEFQSHIMYDKPDIIVINETWLKPSVNDTELLDPANYKLYRLDRSPHTHPPDPLNPLKFRRNGGGVMIAIREDLDITCKQINIKCPAEILSIAIKLSNGKKMIIGTFYRVGNLGIENYEKVETYLQTVCKRRGINNFILIGDLNLNKTFWEHNSSTCSIQQSFLDLFDNLGLSQLISEPTHEHGKTLDILLKNQTDDITELKVMDQTMFANLITLQ